MSHTIANLPAAATQAMMGGYYPSSYGQGGMMMPRPMNISYYPSGNWGNYLFIIVLIVVIVLVVMCWPKHKKHDYAAGDYHDYKRHHHYYPRGDHYGHY